MKKILFLFISICCIVPESFSQIAPQGMKYQAVARTLGGQVMANQPITLSVALGSQSEYEKADYREVHKVMTNQLGLFALTIGHGKKLNGKFEEIPWSEKEIWMEIAIKDRENGEFSVLSSSQMLSVPYAFHAGTANQIAGQSGLSKGMATEPIIEEKAWTIFGNNNISAEKQYLGTRDERPLTIRTNNIIRVVFQPDGNIEMEGDIFLIGDHTVKGTSQVHADLIVEQDIIGKGDITIDGGGSFEDFKVNNKLTVAGEVELNTESGGTLVHGDLKVDDMSSTELTGDLDVDGTVHLNKTNGTTHVSGSTIIGGELSVTNMSNTRLTGDLRVDGQLDMRDGIFVTADVPDGGFVASFENRDDENGDGIKIKLGKTHPRWNGNGEVELVPPGQGIVEGVSGAAENLFMSAINNGGFELADLEVFGTRLIEISQSELAPGFDFVVAESCKLTNTVIAEINDKLSLPLTVGPLATPSKKLSSDIVIFGDGPDDDDDPDLVVPGVTVPSLSVTPVIELVPLLTPIAGCPTSLSFTESFDLPNFQLVDVDNTLDNNNKFIQFTDEADRQLGAIQAQSIEEWGHSYLNPTFFLNIFNSFAGVTVIGIDPTQILETAGKYAINAVAQFSTIIDSYNEIGVVYNSGFGDYAEWLERKDHNELITAGDIVGVIGGKISKELKGAEQIMAISSNPIVLGNAPEQKDEHLGNKVAFMGQIPVKIMGPVSTGDFIVAHDDIPGYGKAVSPSEMTVEDFENAVGRSWETLAGEGVKMVNTVVGVHNGSMLNIMKKVVSDQKRTDVRLTTIENQLNTLLPIAKSDK